MKGLIAYIYKNGNDCTNGGISSKAQEVLVTGSGIPEIFEANGLPIVELKQGHFKDTCYASPIHAPGGGMFGGNFIYTSDSRFSEAVERIIKQRFYGALPLHDRFEF